MKIKELLFRTFSLPAGLLAFASVLVLSYFYYRLQINTPFAYEQIIANISEYRLLDSRINVSENPRQINFSYVKDNLDIQQSLMVSTEELLNNLSNSGIKVPNTDALFEIEKNITLRIRWLSECLKRDSCNVEEWRYSRAKAHDACGILLASFYNLVAEQEEAWSKNLKIFYILSVMLLLSTLFFAAKRKE
ncbi:MAG: hypothetical protein LBC75_05880 [Fibromonadaceae bacterium]|jgi:hypothetical protein|nr:hypothetical protein [Fibromonadaceae bacterium]